MASQWRIPLTNRTYVPTLTVEAPLTIVFFNPQCTWPARPVCVAAARRVAASVCGSMSLSWIPRHSGVLDMEGESP
jgi:hypothetical protein